MPSARAWKLGCHTCCDDGCLVHMRSCAFLTATGGLLAASDRQVWRTAQTKLAHSTEHAAAMLAVATYDSWAEDLCLNQGMFPAGMEGPSSSSPAAAEALPPTEPTGAAIEEAAASTLSNKQRQRLKRLSKQMGTIQDQLDERKTCVMCKTSFESRSKLFKHLETCRGKGGKANKGRAPP